MDDWLAWLLDGGTCMAVWWRLQFLTLQIPPNMAACCPQSDPKSHSTYWLVQSFSSLEVNPLVQPHLRGEELESTSWRKEHQITWGLILKPLQPSNHNILRSLLCILLSIKHIFFTSPLLTNGVLVHLRDWLQLLCGYLFIPQILSWCYDM